MVVGLRALQEYGFLEESMRLLIIRLFAAVI
jgi:hypothetical protein